MAAFDHKSIMKVFWGATAVAAGALVVAILNESLKAGRPESTARPLGAGEPRRVGESPVDDQELSAMPTEEEARIGIGLGNQGPGTCTYGWTFICDQHPPGQTCKTGFTYKCDTGTCTYGFTLTCDSYPKEF
jgi:hypothetical protein